MIKVLPARDDDKVEATTLTIVRDALVSDPDAISKTSTKDAGERSFPISLPVLVLPPRPAN
jgi:hypothetical protein